MDHDAFQCGYCTLGQIVSAIGCVQESHAETAADIREYMSGNMIWDIGSALHEATEIDDRAARYANDNLAEYLVPVNADIDRVEVIMLPEEGDGSNPLGIKGLGELGNVGTNAAVANAVFHATGIRVRDLPIRLESLL